MILLKLSLLAFVVATHCSGSPPNGYLVYATLKDARSANFIKTDLGFQTPTTLFTARIQGNGFDKMHIGYDRYEHVLYYSFKNYKYIESYGLETGQSLEKDLNEKFGTFLGVGFDDDLYLYSKETGTFLTCGFFTDQRFIRMGVEGISCLAVNPLNRKQVFYEICPERTGQIYDDKKSQIVETYDQKLPTCFVACGFTPNGDKIYAVKDGTIYLSPRKGAPFQVFTSIDESIRTFAVGNNELFFTTEKAGKIFKMSTDKETEGGGYLTTAFDVEGHVVALALHQD